MKRFIIYRCPEKCSCHKRLKEHELIGVSVGENIEEVSKDIISQIEADLTSVVPEAYSTGTFDIVSMDFEENSRRYKWSIAALFIPDNPSAPKNFHRDYGICVKDENEA